MSNPPRYIPIHLYNEYTMNGLIKVRDFYFNHAYFNKTPPIWDNSFMQNYLNDITIDNIVNSKATLLNYGIFCGKNILSSLISLNYDVLSDKKVAVIGSQIPWVECICLNLGIRDVTTVDYNPPICESNIITSISIDTFIQNQDKYDIILSFSSIEHSGLGRYGDPLDPNADLKTTQLIHSKLKDDGFFILAVPIGKDAIEWNAHRIYGPNRFPKLIENFQIVNYFGYDEYYKSHEKMMDIETMERIINNNNFGYSFQPVFVLTPLRV